MSVRRDALLRVHCRAATQKRGPPREELLRGKAEVEDAGRQQNGGNHGEGDPQPKQFPHASWSCGLAPDMPRVGLPLDSADWVSSMRFQGVKSRASMRAIAQVTVL